jgi:hypothetical protein
MSSTGLRRLNSPSLANLRRWVTLNIGLHNQHDPLSRTNRANQTTFSTSPNRTVLVPNITVTSLEANLSTRVNNSDSSDMELHRANGMRPRSRLRLQSVGPLILSRPCEDQPSTIIDRDMPQVQLQSNARKTQNGLRLELQGPSSCRRARHRSHRTPRRTFKPSLI